MNFEEICRKIKELKIQGASDVAKNGMKALLLRLNEVDPKDKESAITTLIEAKNRLINIRPTEPLLRNSIQYIILKTQGASNLKEVRDTVQTMQDKFFTIIRKGKEKIAKVGARRIKGTVLTHCHSTTALGILKKSKEDIDKVFVSESRPKYQGRLTAKELVNDGFDTTLIVDSAVRHYMKKMDYCVVGADVITSEGNVINKIGTSAVALAANEARIPLYVATNLLKFDPETISGALEEIEERSWKEVWKKKPKNLKIKNPAFDVTPKEYIDGLITEAGIISPELIVQSVRDNFPWVLEEEK